MLHATLVVAREVSADGRDGSKVEFESPGGRTNLGHCNVLSCLRTLPLVASSSNHYGPFTIPCLANIHLSLSIVYSCPSISVSDHPVTSLEFYRRRRVRILVEFLPKRFYHFGNFFLRLPVLLSTRLDSPSVYLH